MNIKAPSQRKEINKEKSKLDHKKRKVIINDLMMELSNKSPDLYYMPTVEVAQRIWEQLSSAEPGISKDKSELVSHLTVRDIQILLGHHSDTHDHLL
jgi:PHP family Zn ribbon phosphoesterase